MVMTVRQARQFAGFTQAKMAETMGVSRHTWMKIERCPDNMTIDMSARFCRAVNIPADSICYAHNSTNCREAQ